MYKRLPIRSAGLTELKRLDEIVFQYSRKVFAFDVRCHYFVVASWNNKQWTFCDNYFLKLMIELIDYVASTMKVHHPVIGLNSIKPEPQKLSPNEYNTLVKPSLHQKYAKFSLLFVACSYVIMGQSFKWSAVYSNSSSFRETRNAYSNTSCMVSWYLI